MMDLGFGQQKTTSLRFRPGLFVGVLANPAQPCPTHVDFLQDKGWLARISLKVNEVRHCLVLRTFLATHKKQGVHGSRRVVRLICC